MVTKTSWSPDSHEDYDTLKGMTVVSADGENVGTIETIFHPKQAMPQARGGHYFLVKPGMMKSWFGTGSEVYVPESAIGSVSTEAVRLTYGKDELEAQGWDQGPTDLENYHQA